MSSKASSGAYEWTLFLLVWPDVKQIEVRDDAVVMRAAIVGDVERIVQLDAASHDGAQPSNQGHSIGHFEGNALVVDTARLRTGSNATCSSSSVSRVEHG